MHDPVSVAKRHALEEFWGTDVPASVVDRTSVCDDEAELTHPFVD